MAPRAELVHLMAAAGLGDDTVLLARRHPALEDDISGSRGLVADVSRYANAAELLVAADVLITDYSAALVDFTATGRPRVPRSTSPPPSSPSRFLITP